MLKELKRIFDKNILEHETDTDSERSYRRTRQRAGY